MWSIVLDILNFMKIRVCLNIFINFFLLCMVVYKYYLMKNIRDFVKNRLNKS